LHPSKSLIRNIGHDGTGVHCGKSDVFINQITTNYILVKNIKLIESAIARAFIDNYYKAQSYKKTSIKTRILNKLKRMAGVA
jgi:hypothetical protein